MPGDRDVRADTRFSVLAALKLAHVTIVPYLSTVPNQAGQYRFLLLCPAVPPSTSLVLNSFDVAKFVRLFASTLVTPGKKMWPVPTLAYVLKCACAIYTLRVCNN